MKDLKDIILEKRIKEWEIEGKKIPELYLVVFNDYLEEIAESLADYTKQVREQVCEMIKKFVDDYTKQHAGYYYDPDVNAQDLYDFLDQIEEGENDEKTTYK